MALFKILRGNDLDLESVEKHDGYAYFVPETGNFYIDAPLIVPKDKEPDADKIERIQLNSNLSNRTKILYSGTPNIMTHSLTADKGVIAENPVDTSNVEEIAGQHVTLDEVNSLLSMYAEKNSLNDYVLKDEAKIFLTESDLTPYVLTTELDNYVHKNKSNDVTGSINLLNYGIQCNATTPISSELSYYRPVRVSNIMPKDEEGNNGDIWIIYKEAEGKIYLSKNNIVLTDENYNKGVEVIITNNSDGQITYNPMTVNGVNLSLSGNVLTIKGDGKTVVDGINIFIGAKNCKKYSTPSEKIITISTNYRSWSWGDQTAVGDVSWWEGLYNWVQNSTITDRKACIGRTKKLTLSKSVLGANTVVMICIGADEDGDNTLTFQTMNALPNNFATPATGGWVGSTQQTQCINFYNACQIQNYIKKVKKGVAKTGNSKQNGLVTYNWETVWLLSLRELNFDPSDSSLSAVNSTQTNAECTYGFNASYSYYQSNSRTKYKTNADGGISDSNNITYFTRSQSYTGYLYWVNAESVSHRTSSSDTTDYLAPAFVIGKND